MGKIKSKCKINLSRCRGWNQIDAPSVHASKICSPKYGRLAAGEQGAGRKSNMQEIFWLVSLYHVQLERCGEPNFLSLFREKNIFTSFK